MPTNIVVVPAARRWASRSIPAVHDCPVLRSCRGRCELYCRKDVVVRDEIGDRRNGVGRIHQRHGVSASSVLYDAQFLFGVRILDDHAEVDGHRIADSNAEFEPTFTAMSRGGMTAATFASMRILTSPRCSWWGEDGRKVVQTREPADLVAKKLDATWRRRVSRRFGPQVLPICWHDLLHTL